MPIGMEGLWRNCGAMMMMRCQIVVLPPSDVRA